MNERFINIGIVIMNVIENTKEDGAIGLFGRSCIIALSGGQCVKCGKFNLEFRDELSRKEYGISVFCQCCQDLIWGD